MRIAVIGAGAMGSIYGGHLSQHNDVLLVDTNEKVVEQVANNGLLIDEDGTTHTYHQVQSATRKDRNRQI